MTRGERAVHDSRVCLERPVRCGSAGAGCDWAGTFRQLASHEESCVLCVCGVGKIHDALQGTATRLEELETALAMKLRHLHNDMPQLVQLITEHRAAFTAVPEGPLGMLLSLKSEHKHLASAAERALWGNIGLTSFTVTNYQDERVLRDLASQLPEKNDRRACLKTHLRVFVRRPEPRFDNIECSPGETYTRLADVFNIRSDVVFNNLCDHWMAARTLLFTCKEEAMQALFVDLRQGARLQAFASNGLLERVWCVTIKGPWRGEGGTESVEARERPKGLLSDVCATDKTDTM
eukprot:6154568-Prymnesium_polylepis.1